MAKSKKRLPGRELELIRVTSDGKKISINIESAKDAEGMDILARAAAQLMVTLAFSGAKTGVTCHPGCTFAAMIDMAHNRFHVQFPDEYHRIVAAGLLTKSVTTGVGH